MERQLPAQSDTIRVLSTFRWSNLLSQRGLGDTRFMGRKQGKRLLGYAAWAPAEEASLSRAACALPLSKADRSVGATCLE